jgi:hypothetical protein
MLILRKIWNIFFKNRVFVLIIYTPTHCQDRELGRSAQRPCAVRGEMRNQDVNWQN